MKAAIEAFLAARSVASRRERRARSATRLILLLVTLLLASLALVLHAAGDGELLVGSVLGGALLVLGMLVVERWLPPLLTGASLVALMLALSSALLALTGTIRTPLAALYPLTIVAAGLLLGARASGIATVVTGGAALLLLQAERTGELAPVTPLSPTNMGLEYTLIFAAATALGAIAVGSIQRAHEQARRNERALAQRNFELEQFHRSLEAMVRQRTRALYTALSISRRLAALTEESALVRDVVAQLQSGFGYPHAHVFLLDETGERLHLRGATDHSRERGFLSVAHRVDVGEGIVGRVAATRQPVLVSDIAIEKPDLPPLALMPGSQSVLALPILLGSELLGVLEVQSAIPGALTESDAALLRLIADQLATSIRTARAFQRARARARNERVLNRFMERVKQSHDVPTAMRLGADELATALEASGVGLRLDLGEARE